MSAFFHEPHERPAAEGPDGAGTGGTPARHAAEQRAHWRRTPRAAAALNSALNPAAGAEERANKWAVLGLVGLATFMTTLDSSIVNISLPSIARAFGVALGGAVEWVIISYLVVTAALLLTCGRLADLY